MSLFVDDLVLILTVNAHAGVQVKISIIHINFTNPDVSLLDNLFFHFCLIPITSVRYRHFGVSPVNKQGIL